MATVLWCAGFGGLALGARPNPADYGLAAGANQGTPVELPFNHVVVDGIQRSVQVAQHGL